MLQSASANTKFDVMKKLAPFLERDMLASSFLITAVLSGRLSFASLIPLVEQPAFYLEFRFWTTGFAVLMSLRLITDIRQHLSAFLICTYALLAYLVLRSLHLAGSGGQIADAIYLAVQLTTLTVLASRARCLSVIGGLALFAAGGLFTLALLGVNDEVHNGSGWAPIGGTITFYRLEFFGFCIALYCFLGRPRITHLFMLSVFFFGTWASLSKVATVASLVALAPVFSIGLARHQFGRIALLTLAILISYLVWQDRFGTTMRMRVAESGAFRTATAVVQPGSNLPGLKPGQDLEIRAEYCISSTYQTPNCRSNSLVDQSGRLIMIAEALRGFIKSPVFGNGLGQYRVISVNSSTRIEQAYLYPHNIIAELLYSGGIVAIALFLLLVGFAVSSHIPAMRRDPRNSAIVAFLIFILLSAFASGDLYDLRLFLFASVALSALNCKAADAKN